MEHVLFFNRFETKLAAALDENGTTLVLEDVRMQQRLAQLAAGGYRAYLTLADGPKTEVVSWDGTTLWRRVDDTTLRTDNIPDVYSWPVGTRVYAGLPATVVQMLLEHYHQQRWSDVLANTADLVVEAETARITISTATTLTHPGNQRVRWLLMNSSQHAVTLTNFVTSNDQPFVPDFSGQTKCRYIEAIGTPWGKFVVALDVVASMPAGDGPPM